jgi:hypothetical protein
MLCFCLPLVSCSTITPPIPPEEKPQNDLQNCPEANIVRYALVTKIEGELTTSDCIYGDATIVPPKYIDYYSLSVDQQTRITILFNDYAAQLNISIFDSNQKDMPLSQGLGVFTTQVTPGNYTIAVFSIIGDVGQYTLSTSTDEKGFNGCSILSKIELGTKVDGEITASDCTFGADLVDYYEFSLTEQDTVAICGGAGVSLFLRDGTPLETNIIARNGCFLRDLQPGSYVFAKYNFGSQFPFTYSLMMTTTHKGFFYCSDVRSLEFGVTEQGKLDMTDCGWPPYPYECGNICGSGGFGKSDYYEFELGEPKEIEVLYTFSGKHPFWRIFDRRTGYGDIGPFEGDLTLKPGKYVLVVGYQFYLSEDPPYTPVEELESYTLTVNIK